jgi:putative membrane protein
MTTPGMAATTSGATSADASTNNAAMTFATTAGPANLFEIQSSQLALKQTQTSDVTAFAQRMITDHTKAGQDMDAALKSDNIAAPAPALTQDQQQQMSQLQGLKGQDFDKAYIQAQVKAHDDAVDLFQNYSQSGPDGALKTFATKTLPVLKTHQQMIHKLAGK